MDEMPIARGLLPAGRFVPAGRVVLDYEGRMLRRRRLVSEAGESFLVDLPEVVALMGGEGFALGDGRAIEVVPAVEEVIEIRGDLPRLAWHIGNRHTPCRIEAERLLIRPDHVLEAMLAGLGARLARVNEAFRPEGGAYGLGRTMGHAHGEAAPDHGHDHAHAHDHDHSHGHSHSHGHAPRRG